MKTLTLIWYKGEKFTNKSTICSKLFQNYISAYNKTVSDWNMYDKYFYQVMKTCIFKNYCVAISTSRPDLFTFSRATKHIHSTDWVHCTMRNK